LPIKPIVVKESPEPKKISQKRKKQLTRIKVLLYLSPQGWIKSGKKRLDILTGIEYKRQLGFYSPKRVFLRIFK